MLQTLLATPAAGAHQSCHATVQQTKPLRAAGELAWSVSQAAHEQVLLQGLIMSQMLQKMLQRMLLWILQRMLQQSQLLCRRPLL